MTNSKFRFDTTIILLGTRSLSAYLPACLHPHSHLLKSALKSTDSILAQTRPMSARRSFARPGLLGCISPTRSTPTSDMSKRFWATLRSVAGFASRDGQRGGSRLKGQHHVCTHARQTIAGCQLSTDNSLVRVAEQRRQEANVERALCTNTCTSVESYRHGPRWSHGGGVHGKRGGGSTGLSAG